MAGWTIDRARGHETPTVVSLKVVLEPNEFYLYTALNITFVLILIVNQFCIKHMIIPTLLRFSYTRYSSLWAFLNLPVFDFRNIS